MDPREFISLALRLANSPNEADLRTAVSRAYYGAFHVAHAFLDDCGLRWPRKEMFGAEIHRKVRFCLSESDNADIAFASDRLGSLRDLRNMADYHLVSTKFERPASVAAMVRAAPEIVDALERIRLEPAFQEARDKIRSYARDVLRITVEDV